MTPRAAGAAIRVALKGRALPFTKVRARTVSFSDLARASKVFVTVEGWRADRSMADELRAIGKANGFIVDFLNVQGGADG